MKSENLQLGRVQSRAGVFGALYSLHETLESWQRRARERSELAQLDTWAKRDLGLSDTDIWREASKHCWRA